MSKADIGLIGLAVMGENLALNMERNGFTVAVFNRTAARTKAFVEGRAKDKNIAAAFSLPELVAGLKKPRMIMLMVKAGGPVDSVIEQLLPLLEQGDLIIDGGNSHFLDTKRRAKQVEKEGLLYVGAGVSGGELGALYGPSLMPGGSSQAWPQLKPIFQAIAAKVEEDQPCCQWIGQDGAGHFVKMVHNGIEYGDMQLICEAYHLMKVVLGMSAGEMAETFAKWNEGELESYLIEITSEILAFRDEDGEPLVDKILDTAEQKGTGRWTAISALEEAVPLTLIAEAVFSRNLSALKDERVAASELLKGPEVNFAGDKESFLEDIRRALYASKIVSYAQGYDLLKKAAASYAWDLDYGGIALIWRGGCIIRSAFLGEIKKAYERDGALLNLLLDPFFQKSIASAAESWRRVCATALVNGIPVPAFTSALNYFDGYRSSWLPANLLQAQRDYFGAHSYERVDRPRGEYFHTNWTGAEELD